MAAKKKHLEISAKRLDYFLFILFILAIVLLFFIIKPFLLYLILGVIIVMFLHPVNKLMQKWIHNRIISSFVMIFVVLLLILIPSVFLISSVIGESSTVVNAIGNINLDDLSVQLSEQLNYDVNLRELIDPLIIKIGEFLTVSLPKFISSITEIVIGIFVMFFLMYYGFKEGEELMESFLKILPMTKAHKKELVVETKKVLGGVLYGQLLVALIQGLIGGIGFWIFGVPNPILWGFAMVILAFIPFLGTPMVWVPAVIYEFSIGNIWIGVALLLYNGLLTTNIDNIIKPKIIGTSTGMHPVLVLLGIFGGIVLFGILGMIIGPVVVALCTLIIKFFNRDIHVVDG